MSRHLTMSVAALVVPAALLATPAAHAEKVVTRDPAGDAIAMSEADGTMQFTPAPANRTVDIVRTVVDHGDDRMRVSVKFRELGRDPFLFLGARVQTPRAEFDVAVQYLRRKPRVVGLVNGSDVIECRGVSTSVYRSTRSITLSVPTSCLGDPRWVRVGLGAEGLDLDQEDPEVPGVYSDDANRFGDFADFNDFADLGDGPKVRRG